MTCGSLEIDILNSIWELAEVSEDSDISIQDVVDHLSNKGIERAYTTIKTVMDRLTLKSVLVRYKSGKKFFYKAAMQKEEMALEAINKVVSNFFDGNSTNLIWSHSLNESVPRDVKPSGIINIPFSIKPSTFLRALHELNM